MAPHPQHPERAPEPPRIDPREIAGLVWFGALGWVALLLIVAWWLIGGRFC